MALADAQYIAIAVALRAAIAANPEVPPTDAEVAILIDRIRKGDVAAIPSLLARPSVRRMFEVYAALHTAKRQYTDVEIGKAVYESVTADDFPNQVAADEEIESERVRGLN